MRPTYTALLWLSPCTRSLKAWVLELYFKPVLLIETCRLGTNNSEQHPATHRGNRDALM